MSSSIDLSQLNVDERAALVGLTKAVILSDGMVAAEEQDAVAQIAAALGEEEYRNLLALMDDRLPDDERLKKFLTTISRQPARDLIYGIVLEAATAGAVTGTQTELLSWLEKTWNIQVKVADPGQPPPRR